MAKKKLKTTKKEELTLTAKQAKFVELVLNGKGFTEAYMEAYEPPEGKSDHQIYNAVKRVRTKKAVKEALQKGMREVNVNQVLWTKEKAIVKLLKLLQRAEEDLESYGFSKNVVDAILGSIKELNQVAGTYFKDSKKYEVDMANLEIQRLRYELDKSRITGDDGDEVEDDGFLDAISAAAREVWSEEDDE